MKLENMLKQDELTNRSSIDTRFIQAVFDENADRALESIKDLVKKEPDHQAVPVLMERIAKYQFSLGLYNTARETFRYLAQHYKGTKYGESGSYYVSRCWQAIGRADSARLVLEKFLLQYPHSRFSNIIMEELEDHLEAEYLEPEEATGKTSQHKNGTKYSIQTGAFSSLANARIQKEFLKDKGYDSSIYSKQVGTETYFVVCVGEFEVKDVADNYGRKLAEKYKLDYQIIHFDELKNSE